MALVLLLVKFEQVFEEFSHFPRDALINLLLHAADVRHLRDKTRSSDCSFDRLATGFFDNIAYSTNADCLQLICKCRLGATRKSLSSYVY